MHKVAEPSILYFGTPVVLISTVNDNGTYNLAPISSIFWLGWRCVIGISALSKTTENLLRNKEGVLNLPSVEQARQVNALALTTGSNPVPEGKLKKGYRYEPNKFELAGLTPVESHTIRTPRVLECPVQMEAKVAAVHGIADDEPQQRGRIVTIEMRIQRVYLDDSIIMDGHPNRVDPDKWRPLIMSFQQFYGLGAQVHTSTLAEIPEALYYSKDIDRAKELV